MYSQWEEDRELIEWMQEYNRQRYDSSSSSNRSNKLHYYGIDIGGFYEDWKTPLQSQVINYLNKSDVDPEYAEELSVRWEPYFCVMSQNARVYYYEQMTPSERDDLARSLDEAVERFRRFETRYVAAAAAKSSAGDGRFEYDWALQTLVSMQLAENYYRNYLHQTTSSTTTT